MSGNKQEWIGFVGKEDIHEKYFHRVSHFIHALKFNKAGRYFNNQMCMVSYGLVINGKRNTISISERFDSDILKLDFCLYGSLAEAMEKIIQDIKKTAENDRFFESIEGENPGDLY